jgi:hypothetical protein
MTRSRSVSFFFAIFTSGLILADCGIDCPLPEIISPCTCKPGLFDNWPILHCIGSEITQGVIDKLFKALRPSPSEENFLDLDSFELRDTQMTQLDFTQFMYSYMFTFKIYRNPNLKLITGPTIDGNIMQPIQCSLVMIGENPLLNDDGFGETLKYFSPYHLYSNLELFGNGFQGSITGEEFLPGLARFSDLGIINLSKNQIRILGGRQFISNRNLGRLTLDDNPIESIMKDAFLFTGTTPKTLYISATNCSLDDDKISPDHGLNKNRQLAVHLDLTNNNFTTLSEKKFESLMYICTCPCTKCSLNIQNNPIVCDERVKWMKDQKDLFEQNVHLSYCSNDIGYTIFNSTKIP